MTYDYVTDNTATDLFGERDLDLILTLGGLWISRLVDSSLSHKNALQSCIERAKLWLSNSDQLIDPDSNITCMFPFFLMNILLFLWNFDYLRDIYILFDDMMIYRCWFESEAPQDYGFRLLHDDTGDEGSG